jgi:hypothetical protein
MNLELIKDIENEVKRFSNKLKLTKERLTKDNYAQYGCKETGALKRAALDLKMELTKLNK